MQPQLVTQLPGALRRLFARPRVQHQLHVVPVRPSLGRFPHLAAADLVLPVMINSVFLSVCSSRSIMLLILDLPSDPFEGEKMIFLAVSVRALSRC